MKKVCVIMLLVMSACVSGCKAQKPAFVLSDKTGWHKIGDITPDFKKELQEIEIIGADRFDAIRFKAKDASVKIDSFLVHLEDDSKVYYPLNMTVKAGTESKTVYLKTKENSLR